MKEIWKPVNRKGLKTIYFASDQGRIKSIRTDICGRKLEKILNQDSKAKSYNAIGIGGKGTSVHRIIAETFVPNPLNLPEVEHKDGNIHNNFASNLIWVTHSENIRLGFSRRKGLGLRCPKVSRKSIRKIQRLFNEGHSVDVLSERFYKSQFTIRQIISTPL